MCIVKLTQDNGLDIGLCENESMFTESFSATPKKSRIKIFKQGSFSENCFGFGLK